MFGNGKKAKCSRIDTIVGQNTRFEGDMRFSGGLHIDGRLKGNITADSESDAVLTISEQGSVSGDVRVPNLVLNGSVIGDVYVTERLEMASHARVTGNVFYNLLEMAMGAEVNGKLVHKTESPAAVAKLDTALQALDERELQVAK